MAYEHERNTSIYPESTGDRSLEEQVAVWAGKTAIYDAFDRGVDRVDRGNTRLTYADVFAAIATIQESGGDATKLFVDSYTNF